MVSDTISNEWKEITPPDSVGTISNENNFKINVAILPSTPTNENFFTYNSFEKIPFNIPAGDKLFIKTNGTIKFGKIRIDEDNIFGVSATRITDEANVLVELDDLVKSIPVTETFHHLGHEGKVFIHSDRHDAIADAANFDMLIRVPAGNAARQIHMRFNYVGKALTGTLDADVILYKDVIVSADGTPESIMSTNDAVIKNTGVLMFHGPTIDNEPADLGTQKAWTLMVGEKKGASSKEQSVPEYILAPDGNNARDYLIRLTNNSGGIMNVVNAIFFYDSEAT